MPHTRDNDQDPTNILCELCGREVGIKKIGNVLVCKTCLIKIKRRNEDEGGAEENTGGG